MTTSSIESPIPAASPSEETECAYRLAGWWKAADVHPSYPATSATVADLLKAGGGFDCSVELLESWARTKQVGTVPLQSGRFKWQPSNILLAASLLNASRRWLPLHPLHLAKMSPSEVAEAQAAAVGESIFTDLESVDCQTLLGTIANSDDKELRLVLVTALQSKIRLAGMK